jgi:hypothetical protein
LARQSFKLSCFRPDADRGPVLFFALRRFDAICRWLAIVSKLPITPNAMFSQTPNGGYSAL